MPATFKSNEWLLESDTRLKPNVFNDSSASGGERNRPSFSDCPFLTSSTVDSKFVKTTSPFRKDAIVGTAAGACARTSDRIIDCPVKVISKVCDCAHAGPANANKPRQAVVRRTRAHSDSIGILPF